MAVDPRFGKLRIGQLETNFTEDLVLELKESDVSVDFLTKENFPVEYEVYYDGVSEEKAQKLGPVFYTKEADKLSLMNQSAS